LTKLFTIVCVGDSLTVGYQSNFYTNLYRGTPYTVHLEQMARSYVKSNVADLDIVIINKGNNGDSTNGMLSRLPFIIKTEKPNYIIIWAGINDLFAGRNPTDTLTMIAKMVKLCVDSEVSPIICSLTPVEGPPHFNRVIRELNEQIFEFCEKQRIPYVDIYTLLATKVGKLYPLNSDDGVHLSDHGYRVVAEKLFDSIKPILASLN
jgi:lysophospholipase L1-like esterase